jgi:DNA-binding MarR family transcriptional regulator
VADELAAEGLVEFIDNPRHWRSKLVRLTSKGDARYRGLSARFVGVRVGVMVARAAGPRYFASGNGFTRFSIGGIDFR